jgi:DUF4097 and DUF4098 domain-containing protein YvlB
VENVVGDVDVRSGGGNVQYKNVRDREGNLRAPDQVFDGGRESDWEVTEETILISTAGGGIHLEEAPAGARVSTGGGSIEIEDASRFVWATTGGGDIEIEANEGAVEASTGAGDIEVIIREDDGKRGSDVILATGHGEVTLTVPRGFSMDLDLTIAYTRNSRRDFEIVTDLEIDEERTQEWDYDQGSPQKYIYGSGRIEGGRHKVRIRTTNGNIRIREGR